jgi:hypothetical protein
MSPPTATPASKSRCNHQPSTVMHPASQVAPVTSPPGTISHFFRSMFHTTSFFCQELHNEDDHEDSDTLNCNSSPVLSIPVYIIHQTVLYIKQVPPVPVLILDIDSTEPLLLCFIVKTHQGHVFDTLSRFLCIVPDHIAAYIASFPQPLLEISVGNLTPIQHFPHLGPCFCHCHSHFYQPLCQDFNCPSTLDQQAGLASTFSPFTPSTAATLHAVVSLSQQDQTALVAPHFSPALLFDGTPAKMKDLQCQFAQCIEICNYAKTGFLLIPDADGICHDIFQDSTYLLMEDFVCANDLLIANTSPAGAALCQVSLLLFQHIQNFCTPTFQTTMRADHKLFYKTSFLLYYGTMLERCQLTGIDSIIDVKTYCDQLSKSALTALLNRHNFDVILLFSDITCLMAHLLCLGHSKEDMTGTTILVLTTSPNTSFTCFMDNHQQSFLLKEALYHATATDTSKFDALHKSASNEYLLLHKDGWYYKVLVSDADGLLSLLVFTSASAPLPHLLLPQLLTAQMVRHLPTRPCGNYFVLVLVDHCPNMWRSIIGGGVPTTQTILLVHSKTQNSGHSVPLLIVVVVLVVVVVVYHVQQVLITFYTWVIHNNCASLYPNLCSCSSCYPFLLYCYIWCTPQDAL